MVVHLRNNSSYISLTSPVRTRPHTSRSNLEWSFISPVMSSVNRNPSRKHSLLKTLFKLEKFKNAAFRFSVDGEHFGNDDFKIDDISLSEIYSN